uniref:CCN family member 3 n=1 Tax=Malurus cyaneus samueli TaxID=2593467 RepID=A0A8C5UJ33_9PASS
MVLLGLIFGGGGWDQENHKDDCCEEVLEAFSFFSSKRSPVEPEACTFPCQCPSQHLECPAGTSHIWDACGCCKVCAQQLGELCSLHRPCDHHKGLYCDFSKIHRGSGICSAHEGATCDLLGKIYLNGESFQPTCKLQCICMDGAIGCIPLCSDDVRLPSPECPNPRRVKFHNKCCEEWLCEEGSKEKSFGMAMAGQWELNSLQENCLVQTTEWSACSRSCGMGISTRVTNDNPQCRLEKETRLCIVRPCNFSVEKTKVWCWGRGNTAPQMSGTFSGCTSTHSYRPRFCGSCSDGRCCTPFLTSTIDVEFCCPEGDFFQRKMMFIKMCSCHYDCPRDNDIFLATYHRRMIGDHIKTEQK